MIQLYTGDGKGKTTAAVGQCMRAAGNGYRVLFAQFMKGNDTGELKCLTGEGIRILRSEKNFGFFKNMTEEQKEELTGIHDDILEQVFEAVFEEQVQVVVLDEITYPVNWGLVSTEKFERLISLVKERNEARGNEKCLPELILTGRDASKYMTNVSDYITNMQAIRHPYEKGVAARAGIEY